MADVRKTVEIALQVVGVDIQKVSEISKVFSNIQKTIEAATSSVGKFQKSLDSVKTPKAISQVVESLKQVDKIKVPNLTNIVNGFDKLGKMSKPPSIAAFVNAVQKFSNLKLTGVATLVNGFKKFTELPINAIVAKIKQLNTALAELYKKGGMSTFNNFTKDLSKIKTAFTSAASSLSKMKTAMESTGKATDNTGFRIRSFADKVRTVLQFRLISEALLQIKDAVRAAAVAIIEYDQALKDLQAITGATNLEVAQMGITILEVASRTKFSASEIAAGMRVIGQAGFSASEAVETMQAVSDLATGTLSDMSTTVDLVTTAMRVFQIDASRSAEIADVFANSVNKSKLTIDKLKISMNYIGPIARDSGVTFKELAASMGTLANSGLRASTIGTGLRRVFAELIDPSKKLREAARIAGVALQDLDPRSESLSAVISNLSLVVGDAQVAFDVFGKRGAAAVLALSGSGSKFEEMLGLVGRSGIAAQQAAIQMEGLGVSFKNLKDKLGILAIAIGEMGIADAMRIIINISRNVIDVLTLLINTTLVKFVAKLGLVTLAIFGLVAAFTAFKVLAGSKFIVALTGAFVALGAAVKGVVVSVVALNVAVLPILAVIGTLAALGYAAFKILSDGAKKTSEEAALLAEKYDVLEKKLRDYRETTVNMVDGSKELAEVNIELRRQLLEVANGNSELSESALKAANDINPLNGIIKEGSTALQEYSDILNKFQTDALVLAVNKAGESLEAQTDLLHRWTNRWKSAFGQVGIYVKAFGNTAYDILNVDFTNIPKRWVSAWKEATGKSEEIRKALDLSAGINDGTVKLQELKDTIKTFDLSNLTVEQESLIKVYDSLNNRAVKFVQHYRDIGKLSLRDTLENMEKLSNDSGLTGIALEAVVAEFKKLKIASEDTFSNIIEKWTIDDEPKFLTNLVKGFKEIGGIIDENALKNLKAMEASRAARIEELDKLKETIEVAKKSGVNMEKFWEDYYSKEQAILKTAQADRRILSKNEEAQQLISYGRELKNLEDHLNKIRVLFKYNDEERGKALAKARADHQKRIDAIVSGSDIFDSKKQTQAYKKELKEREVTHAKYISSIASLEQNKKITEEVADKRKLESTLAFYKESLEKSINFQNQVDKENDPKEYKKRNKVVLAAEKKFYEQRTAYLKAFTSINNEEETAKIENAISVSETAYKTILKKHKEAAKSLVSELKASYDSDVINVIEYYAKKRDLANDDIDLQKGLLESRIKQVNSEYSKLIEASNSLREKENLRADQTSEILILEGALNSLEEKRIQTLNKLTGAENKETDALREKVKALTETIQKRVDAANISDADTSFLDKQLIELEALKRRQIEELEIYATLDEAQAIRDLHEEERRLKIKQQEKDLYDYRLGLAVEFAASSTSVLSNLVESGIIQSEKFFRAYQAFAIAETLISTYQSAQDAYTNAMKGGIPYVSQALAITSAAAAVAAGLARVAEIRAQVPSYASGGPIEGHSPHSRADNIRINATAGEYMQPVSAVQKYGIRAMNAIRSLQIPKKALTDLLKGSTAGLIMPKQSFALAEGGSVSVGMKEDSGNIEFGELASYIKKMSEVKKQPINILNVSDPRQIDQYLSTSKGQNAILNVIGVRNQAVQRILKAGI